MSCDCVLLNGNVIVNESILTGESVPVVKTALSENPNERINLKDHSRHILFNGTHVIQTRFYENEKIKAVVIRTGFNTVKGELIRSILHPKPVDFRFNNDTYKYIGGLSIISIIGMIFTLVLKIIRQDEVSEIIVRTLDIVTIVIPPALPGALTACVIFFQGRLNKKNIFCISPRSINISGSIDTFVFDKTGTLTEDGLNLKFVVPVGKDGSFANQMSDLKQFKDKNSISLLEAMSSCHSLTHLNGKLDGDPLDVKMFEFTQTELIEPIEENLNFDNFNPPIVRSNDFNFEIGLIKQFPFSSKLQRMSVITRKVNDETFNLYCKGSPEKVAELSKPDSSNIYLNFNLKN